MMVQGFTIFFCLITALALAGQPDTLPNGSHTLPEFRPHLRGQQAQLCVKTADLTDPSQQLIYRWEELVPGMPGMPGGWHAWTEATMIGGVHYNRQGQPTTEFCSKSSSPTMDHPAHRMRLTVEITGGSLLIDHEVRDP